MAQLALAAASAALASAVGGGDIERGYRKEGVLINHGLTNNPCDI